MGTHQRTTQMIRRRDKRAARPAVLRGEDLWRHRVEHAVHDVVRYAVPAVPPQEGVGRARGRRGEEQDTRDDWTQVSVSSWAASGVKGSTYWMMSPGCLSYRGRAGRPSILRLGRPARLRR